MILSAAIMAHPKRAEMAKRLSRTLGVGVVWDEKNSVWDTGRRALLSYPPDATHQMVIQEDAIALPTLLDECERILKHTPEDAPVSLYMGRWRHRPRRYSMKPVVQQAQTAGASFVKCHGPWWGVAVIVPTQDIPALVEFGDKARHPNYDIRIAQFYKAKGIDCWYAMPSIVDHREGDSLVDKGRGRKRQAQWLSIENLDWSRGYITPDDPQFPVTP